MQMQDCRYLARSLYLDRMSRSASRSALPKCEAEIHCSTSVAQYLDMSSAAELNFTWYVQTSSLRSYDLDIAMITPTPSSSCRNVRE